MVAAPSKLQRPSGDRVKTDAKDAVHLARLLRLGEITAVAVPSVDQEAARDLVRAREDCRGDLMRARHRLSKLLLRQGIVYSGGQAWTGPHDAWLRRAALRPPGHADGLRVRLRRGAHRHRPPGPARQGDRRAWPPTASSPRWCAGWAACAGSSTLTGFALAVEIGDWHRFTGNSIGSFVGLVPTEYSSGAVAGRRARSPRPATPTPAGCSSRPPGTTAPATPPGKTMRDRWDTRPRRGTGPRRRRQPAAAPTLDHVQPAQETTRHRQRRHRPRTGRLVLVPGRPRGP